MRKSSWNNDVDWASTMGQMWHRPRHCLPLQVSIRCHASCQRPKLSTWTLRRTIIVHPHCGCPDDIFSPHFQSINIHNLSFIVGAQRLFTHYFADNPRGAQQFFTVDLKCGEIFFCGLFTRWRHVKHTSNIIPMASADTDCHRCKSVVLWFSWCEVHKKSFNSLKTLIQQV